MSSFPALAPVVGSATCTEFGAVSSAEKFKFDVLGGNPSRHPDERR